MVDFGGLADKAKDLVADHSQKIKDGVEKVGGFVGDKIGHEKVDGIEDKIGGFVDKIAGERNPPEVPPVVHPVVPPTPAPPVVPPVVPPAV